MKKQLIPGILILLLGLAALAGSAQAALAKPSAGTHGSGLQEYHLLAAATPLPTPNPIVIGSPTPPDRVLPPVGRNAGLVIAASVLVLIIIAGVLSARLRPKH